MEKDPDVIPVRVAIGASVFIAGAFVALFYVVPSHIRALARNHPRNILYRFGTSLASCVLACVCVCAVVSLYSLRAVAIPDDDGDSAALSHSAPRYASHDTLGTVRYLTGLHPSCNSPDYVLACCVWICTLFSGPCVEAALRWVDTLVATKLGTQEGQQAGQGQQQDVDSAQTLIRVRNVIVAPVVEEWLFRACVLPLYAAAGLRAPASLAFSAATFALAHAHHYVELRRLGYERLEAVLNVAGMLSFTSVFGALVAFTFWRVGSLLGIVLMHAFCNIMSVPKFTFIFKTKQPLPRRVFVGGAYILGIAAWFYIGSTGILEPAGPCAPATWLRAHAHS